MVQTKGSGELVAMDREPRQIGDLATLEMVVDGSTVTRQVRVSACRPVVRQGSIVHEFTLVPFAEAR